MESRKQREGLSMEKGYRGRGLRMERWKQRMERGNKEGSLTIGKRKLGEGLMIERRKQSEGY
jgi:hypothetical protein